MEQISHWKLENTSFNGIEIPLTVLLCAGLIYCFMGYRLFKAALLTAGFLLAGAVAALLSGWLSQGHLLVMAGVGIFGGVCGAMALLFLYRAGIFFLGLLAGLAGTYLILGNFHETWTPWAILGGGFAGGVVAALLEQSAMKIVTAILGAWLTIAAAVTMAAKNGLFDQVAEAKMDGYWPWAIPAVWGLLALIGASAQIGLAGKKKNKENNPN